MTVRSVGERDVLCEWFDQNGNVQERSFPASSLELISDWLSRAEKQANRDYDPFD